MALVVAIVAVGVALAVPTGGGSLALATGGAIAASSVAATAISVATSAVEISAMATATAIAIDAGQVMFSRSGNEYRNPQRKGTPRNNKAQNRMFKDAMREAGIKDPKIMRRIHDLISGANYTYKEIVEIAKSFLPLR